MILVTGATGNIGTQAVRELRDKGAPVRAFVRDQEKATAMLGADVDLAVGDFEDEASVRRAFEGIDTALLVSASGPSQTEHEITVIDAAADAGVRRLVKVSTVGAEGGSECAFFDRHGRAEQHLLDSGLPAVILRGSYYMTNLLMAADQVRNEGKIFAPAEGAEIAAIDPRDVGSAAVAVLTSDDHDGRTYLLTGPEAITYNDMAEQLSLAVDRRVEFVPISDESARQGLTAAGVPDFVTDPLIILFRVLRDGINNQTTDTVRALTGRDPRPFSEFARDHAAAFRS